MGNEHSAPPGFNSKAESAISKLQLNDNGEKIINILLLGETGVGKSTFINSIVNYLSFQNFDKAEKENLIVLIPTSFMAYDKDGNNQRMEIGQKHKNENNEVGSSVTQLIRTYTFSIKGGYRLRLIDTPGMGDTRGPQQDDQNCEYILSYISQLQTLHAICYLFRPQASRATVHFRYCMTQILSRLEKSACDNLIFIFTDSKDFTPGDTYSILKKLSEDIKKVPPHANIPVDTNKFCFDNEPFKYLAAKQRGVQFGMDIRPIMANSWQKSTEQCWKLIDYIAKLKPHNVRNTAAINECRRVIYQLAQPMAEIAQHIDDNLYMLQRHEDHLKRDQGSIDELKKKLYVPIVELEVKELSQPVTVCTDSKCSELYKIGERQKWHYKARCHNPCYLTNVKKDLIGDAALAGCYAMSAPNQSCAECGCHYKVHMHVYYESTTVQREKLDETVQKNVNSKEAVLANARKVIDEIKKKRNELEAELDIIVECNAKFAFFLQNNAITPINDSYDDYIKHLITAENRLGTNADSSKLDSLKQLLNQHNQIKATLKKAQEDQKKKGITLGVVTADDIQSSVEELYKLHHNGSTIKKMYNAQNRSRQNEYLDSEYIHDDEFDRQRHQSTSSTESTDQQGSGSNARGQQHQQQQNRGRQRQRGGNRGRGGRGNYNNSNNPRENTSRADAPPPYEQSWHDYGRGRNENIGNQLNGQQRGRSQNRPNGNASRGGGFNRQNSDPRGNPSPNVQVNVTIPPKGQPRGGQQSSQTYRYDYSDNQTNRSRSNNAYEQNTHINDNYYGQHPSEYQDRGCYPQDPYYNNASQHEDYQRFNSRDEYPKNSRPYSVEYGNRLTEQPGSNHNQYMGSHPQDIAHHRQESQAYYPPQNDQYYRPRSDYPTERQNDTTGFSEAPRYQTDVSRNDYPPANQQRSAYPYEAGAVRNDRPLHNERSFYENQHYQENRAPLAARSPPPPDAVRTQHPTYDQDVAPYVAEHPTAGSIIVEAYPRKSNNRTHSGLQYPKQSEYAERRPNYSPEDPVGAPRANPTNSRYYYDNAPSSQSACSGPRENFVNQDLANTSQTHGENTKSYPHTSRNFDDALRQNTSKAYTVNDDFYDNAHGPQMQGHVANKHGGDPGMQKTGNDKVYSNRPNHPYPKESRNENEPRLYPNLNNTEQFNNSVSSINVLLKGTHIDSRDVGPTRPPRSIDNFESNYPQKNQNAPNIEHVKGDFRDTDNFAPPPKGYQLNRSEEPLRHEYPSREPNRQVYSGDGRTYNKLAFQTELNRNEYAPQEAEPHTYPRDGGKKEYPPQHADTQASLRGVDNYNRQGQTDAPNEPTFPKEHRPQELNRKDDNNYGGRENDGYSNQGRFEYRPTQQYSSAQSGPIPHHHQQDNRNAIERHPENPFQTFEFEPHSSTEYFKQPVQNVATTDDLISFEYGSINPDSRYSQADAYARYPEEFGKVDNPVRVFPTSGQREYQSDDKDGRQSHGDQHFYGPGKSSQNYGAHPQDSRSREQPTRNEY